MTALQVSCLLLISFWFLVEAGDDEQVLSQLISGHRTIYGVGVYKRDADKSKRVAVILSGLGGGTVTPDLDSILVYDTPYAQSGLPHHLRLSGERKLSSIWQPLYQSMKKNLYPAGAIDGALWMFLMQHQNKPYILAYNPNIQTSQTSGLIAYDLTDGTSTSLGLTLSKPLFISSTDTNDAILAHAQTAQQKGYFLGTYSWPDGGASCCQSLADGLSLYLARPSQVDEQHIVTYKQAADDSGTPPKGYAYLEWVGQVRAAFIDRKQVHLLTTNGTVHSFDKKALKKHETLFRLKTVMFKEFFVSHGNGSSGKGSEDDGDNSGDEGKSKRSTGDNNGLYLGVGITLLALLVGLYFYWTKKGKPDGEDVPKEDSKQKTKELPKNTRETPKGSAKKDKSIMKRSTGGKTSTAHAPLVPGRSTSRKASGAAALSTARSKKTPARSISRGPSPSRKKTASNSRGGAGLLNKRRSTSRAAVAGRSITKISPSVGKISPSARGASKRGKVPELSAIRRAISRK